VIVVAPLINSYSSQNSFVVIVDQLMVQSGFVDFILKHHKLLSIGATTIN
jgi:hypothetical protein